jgi:hypothetical protein
MPEWIMKWTGELRKIERAFDGLPPEPSPALVRARRASERRTREQRERRLSVFGTWGRVLLIGVLAGAISFWPYPRACGEGLFAYLGAECLIVAGGVWAVAWTWRTRMGLAHTLACAVILWGCGLIGAQVLPRVGYAKVDASHPPQWSCLAQP